MIIAVAIDFVFKTATIPTAYFIWPPFAFYRILTVLNTNAFTTSLQVKGKENISRFDPISAHSPNPHFYFILQPYKFSMVKPGDEVFTALMFLWVEVIVFLVLAYYLNQTAPSEFGVRRPWNFPIIDLMEMFGNKQKVEELKISTEEEKVREGLEDDDVKAERARVLSNGHPSSSPLIMKGMRKVYASRRGLGPKLAVRDVSLAVEQGLIFGLLGPNGAGKTTLISILTGLYEASYGEATLAGYNIKTQTSMVYKKIGICPQFDILWDDLTISEHLYFYARLKGITSNQEDMEVEKCLQKVKLENFRDRKTKGLSGGEKRRLSIAIALIGDPAVVFLDEPTVSTF